MRRTTSLLILSALFLAACNGGGSPADDQPTDSGNQNPPPAATQNIVIVTREPTLEDGQLPVPLPGTLVASATEDPDIGLVFDHIEFTQTRLSDDSTLTIEIFQDGRVVRDGETLTISEDEIFQIDIIIDELNFFGMQGNFLGPSADSGGQYRYRVRVERAGVARAVTAQDGFMPQELKDFLVAIVQAGVPSQPTS